MVFSRELMDDVEEIFENDYGGHDFFHTLRVMRIADNRKKYGFS